MADDPGRGTLFEGRGVAGNATGCPALVLCTLPVAGIALAAAGAVHAAAAGAGNTVALVLAIAAGVTVAWAGDRLVKRLTWISPLRVIGELPPLP